MGSGIAVLLCGIFCVVCAVMDFNWFMNNRKARLFVKLFGRNGARIFYTILGVLFVVAGIYFMVNG